jgi:ribosome-associated toxin RatA of RatAB toxin-antitoxin module
LSVISRSITISAPPSTILAILLDVESYPAWQATVDRVEVMERDPQGRPVVCRMNAVAGDLVANWTMQYDYTELFRFEYFMLEGDAMKRNDGSYAIAERPDGTSEVSATLGFDLDWPLPAAEIEQLISTAVNDLFEAIKARAEKAA